MSIKRTATRLDIAISDEFDKSFELKNILLDNHTTELMTILRLITVGGFLRSIKFDLPAVWYDHLPFVTNVTVQNEDDDLIFTLVYGDESYAYTVHASDFLSHFDLSNKYDEYEYTGKLIKIKGLEDIHWHWTTDVEEILITDKKSFVILVDRYDNTQLDTFWCIGEKDVFEDCALLDKVERDKLLAKIPEEIFKAMAGNVFYEATL